MGATQLAIKTRMRSIDATKKITKAMQLVASSKLKKYKDALFENRLYAKTLYTMAQRIVGENQDENIYTKIEDGKTVHIIISSDMGLCGGYNTNICKSVMVNANQGDKFISIGSRGSAWLKHQGVDILADFDHLKDLDYDEIIPIAKLVLNEFCDQGVAKVICWHSQFKNSILFEIKGIELLPLSSEGNSSDASTIYEPSAQVLLEEFVPSYVTSMLYSFYLESKTSEQASRRMSMESATDNAESLKDDLLIQYNQARQASITQELSEIIGGVEAMKGKE